VLIAGGGQVARAGVKTSSPRPVPEADNGEWQSLLSSGLNLDHDNARQQFEAFAAGMRITDRA